MADPNWRKRLTPVLSDAVTLVSTLLGPDSTFLETLAQTDCLTEGQSDEISRICGREGQTQAARYLFGILRRRPKPYFDIFCDLLGKVDQGEHLRRLLVPERTSAAKSEEHRPRENEDIMMVSGWIRPQSSQLSDPLLQSPVHQRRNIESKNESQSPEGVADKKPPGSVDGSSFLRSRAFKLFCLLVFIAGVFAVGSTYISVRLPPGGENAASKLTGATVSMNDLIQAIVEHGGKWREIALELGWSFQETQNLHADYPSFTSKNRLQKILSDYQLSKGDSESSRQQLIDVCYKLSLRIRHSSLNGMDEESLAMLSRNQLSGIWSLQHWHGSMKFLPSFLYNR
ncbi:uncharacterized protein [Oscarella lobularis]|uniref:uncharacterized protein n=1 Tax=Oscarella lobularis TaxID=121494 RepID=UPI00331312DE